jgi:hypothetical protein
MDSLDGTDSNGRPWLTVVRGVKAPGLALRSAKVVASLWGVARILDVEVAPGAIGPGPLVWTLGAV